MASSAARRRRTQVKSEAKLRFGPQRSSLNAALSDAVGTYVTNVAAAKTSAEGIKIAADQAARDIPKVYTDAGHSIDNVSGVLAKALGPAGAGGSIADLIRGAGATDVAQTKQRLSESMAGALTETKLRKTDAASGAAYAVTNAGQVLEQTRRKLNQQLVDLSGQRGAFTQGRLAELTDADVKAREANRQKALDRRNSRVTSGVNPDGTIRKGGPKDPAVTGKGKSKAARGLPKGVKPASAADVRTFRSTYAKARGVIAQLRAAGTLEGKAGRHKIAQLLTTGVDTKDTIDPKRYAKEIAAGTDKSLAKVRATVKGAKIPSIDDPLALSAALDMEYDHHVSHANAQALHRAGLRVANVPGLKSYSDWVKTNRGLPSVPQAPGAPGQGRRPT